MPALPDDWALPAVTPLTAAWFTTSSFAVQRCAACATLQHPPEEICHACGSLEFDTEVLGSTGTVHSYTVVHYAASPALAESVPYTIVLVSLDDAPAVRVIGNLDGDAHIGMPVVAYWDERVAEDGSVVWLPQWSPRQV